MSSRSVRPFRFGVSIPSAVSVAEWREKARHVEAVGFDTLLIADHLADGMLSSLALLVAAAEATDRVGARIAVVAVRRRFGIRR